MPQDYLENITGYLGRLVVDLEFLDFLKNIKKGTKKLVLQVLPSHELGIKYHVHPKQPEKTLKLFWGNVDLFVYQLNTNIKKLLENNKEELFDSLVLELEGGEVVRSTMVMSSEKFVPYPYSDKETSQQLSGGCYCDASGRNQECVVCLGNVKGHPYCK